MINNGWKYNFSIILKPHYPTWYLVMRTNYFLYSFHIKCNQMDYGWVDPTHNQHLPSSIILPTDTMTNCLFVTIITTLLLTIHSQTLSPPGNPDTVFLSQYKHIFTRGINLPDFSVVFPSNAIWRMFLTISCRDENIWGVKTSNEWIHSFSLSVLRRKWLLMVSRPRCRSLPARSAVSHLSICHTYRPINHTAECRWVQGTVSNH